MRNADRSRVIEAIHAAAPPGPVRDWLQALLTRGEYVSGTRPATPRHAEPEEVRLDLVEQD
jgi:hypothetical protein